MRKKIFLRLSLLSFFSFVGCGAPPADLDASFDSLESAASTCGACTTTGTVVTPVFAMQLRQVIIIAPSGPTGVTSYTSGCIDTGSASDAAVLLQNKFRAQVSPSAFAAATCGYPVNASGVASSVKATTIGVWYSGNAATIDIPNSLKNLDILGPSNADWTVLIPLKIGTWVSHKLMLDQFDVQLAEAKANEDPSDPFIVDNRDIFLYASNDKIQTYVYGHDTKRIDNYVGVYWSETLNKRSTAETAFVPPYQVVPNAFTVNTVRTFAAVVPDRFLSRFPETGVLRGLVDSGIFPSRLLIKPMVAGADPLLETAVHLKYGEVRVVESGTLKGLVVVCDPPLVSGNPYDDTAVYFEDRHPSVSITRSLFPLYTYTANDFDLRAPLTYYWWAYSSTGATGITINNPTSKTTSVTFANSSSHGMLIGVITDADGVVRQTTRTISQSAP